MSHKVFANAREVSSRSGEGKAACAFPDVCFTPPPAPGVPIPYPNTGIDADTSNGTRSVRIAGREVMLKNKSYFKKSTGDEAGCAPKKGAVTSQITGKVYFNVWSMDVKMEGENVVRHMDLTTHNHGSVPGNTPTWPYLSGVAPAPEGVCGEESERQKQACSGLKNPCAGVGKTKPSGKKDSGEADRLADKIAADDCLSAQRCTLKPYRPNKCCPPQTPHHLVEASAFHNVRRGKDPDSIPLAGIHDYDEHKAPCVCAEGKNQNTGTHGLMHTFQSAKAARCPEDTLPLSNGGMTELGKVTTYAQARDNGIAAFHKVFPRSKCSKECLQAQLDSYHKQCGVQDSTRIRAVETGQTDLSAAERAVEAREKRVTLLKSAGDGDI
jgi:hypothetical protein